MGAPDRAETTTDWPQDWPAEESQTSDVLVGDTNGKADADADDDRRLDLLPTEPETARLILGHYLGLLRLHPEDVYEIAPIFERRNVIVGWEVVYRDQPGYAAARVEWARRKATGEV